MSNSLRQVDDLDSITLDVPSNFEGTLLIPSKIHTDRIATCTVEHVVSLVGVTSGRRERLKKQQIEASPLAGKCRLKYDCLQSF